MGLIRNMRAGARLRADREDSETTCQHKKKRKAQPYTRTHTCKRTTRHTRARVCAHTHTHTHTHAHKHTAAVTRVYRDRHGDKTTFCVLSCETPQEYSWQEAETQAPWGSLAFVSHTFSLLFCSAMVEGSLHKPKISSPNYFSTCSRLPAV